MNNIIKRVWNQNRMVNIEDLRGMAFQAEDGGHTFEISGVNDAGESVELSGTVTGVFMRPDNADIALTGTSSDGIASVTLTDDCYAVNGRFGLTIFVTDEQNQKVAVYACVGTVARSSTGGVAGSTPQDVVDLINAINAAVATIPADYTDLMAAIAPTYSNTALYAVGFYAWYDGNLYRCISAITTAESWTAAHWTAAVLGNDVADLMTSVTSNEKISFTNGYIKTVASNASVDLSVLTDTTTVCAVVTCTVGEIFHIYGTPINVSTKRPFMFVTSENVCYFRSEQCEKFAEEVVAPITGKLVINLSKSADYAVYRNKVELSLWTQATLNGLIGIVPQNYTRRLATGTSEASTIYTLQYINGSTADGYTTDTYAVTSGELLIASGIVPTGAQYRLALFYDASGNFLGYHNRVNGQIGYISEPIICPPHTASVKFSHATANPMRVYRVYTDVSTRKRVTRDGDLIKVSDGTYTLWMSKHGNNNLMDLQYIRKGDTNLHTTGTDWQGPYVVSAKHNADGDAIAQGQTYTGGNHAYAYDGGSGSATARTLSFKVVADGIELEDGGEIEWKDYVEISWVNRVQAWNTKKSDGTGREVLEENPVWTFKPHGIVDVQNTITALEDITVSVYYGMQMTAAWLSKGLFIPTATRDIDSVSNIYNGFGSEFDGSVVKGYDTNLDITMELDTTFDLGTGVCIGNQKQTHINASKAYMRTVHNTDFDEDNVFAYRGRYTFRCPS